MGVESLKLGIVGCGRQAHALIDSINRITPQVRPSIAALCDPWPYALLSAQGLIKSKRGEAQHFSDIASFLQEASGDLDAVIIASPDYLHESQARACLEHSLNVYLEPPMAMTADGAKDLVELSDSQSRLLQVGYHRRSHPNLRYALAKQNREALFGGINIAKAHCSLPRMPHYADPDPQRAVPAQVLEELGYQDMGAFLNWQRSKIHCAGRLRSEVSHQIDVFNWCLGRPRAVLGAGMRVHHDDEHLQNADSILEYAAADGSTARAVSHLQVGNSDPGIIELLHGLEATGAFDEIRGVASICPERHADPKKFDISGPMGLRFEKRDTFPLPTREENEKILASIPRPFCCSGGSGRIVDRSVYFKTPFSRPCFLGHLWNFFQAIERDMTNQPPDLHCPPEVAYDTTLTCLQLERAVESHQRVIFDEGEWLAT